MKTVSIKQARQQFSRLVDQAQTGSSVVITRRGRKVATLGPFGGGRKGGMPDLTEFRASLGKPKGRATIEELRRDQRY
jgi:prevent-host-death family protein